MSNELEKYYNKFCEEKRLTRRHGNVEYITSMKYIHKYLKDKNVTVKEGLAVSRTDIEKSQKKTVENWLKELGYK